MAKKTDMIYHCESLNSDIFIEVEDREKRKEEELRRMAIYAEKIQELVQQKSRAVVEELVEERHEQKKTQQDIADLTGLRASNLARLEGSNSIPTLLVLEKYASALGKHIEIKICDNKEDKEVE